MRTLFFEANLIWGESLFLMKSLGQTSVSAILPLSYFQLIHMCNFFCFIDALFLVIHHFRRECFL